ncbi:regulatory protein RecX [Cellulomonas edaphi]|uniref:Regulatory protein RecX n=1 Tax=Cellulomonas edaphi TaxID=3053468 RepID=A0ABT7S905_9CELL|nr:regulatory protein RecX [Cellulomons edaphi]MDM7832071.1 regulatory protein RecX [Cellulomons edaphi]
MSAQPGRRSRRSGAAVAGPEDGPDAAPGGFASDAQAEEAAREIALRQLAAAPRSRGQLEAAMAKKLVPADVAGRVLDRFTEVGLVDDAEFAAMLVRTRHAERGQSRRAIAVELRRKGIDEETAAVALEQVDADDEEAAARELVRRKLRVGHALDPEVRRRRIYGALGRKGYPPGLVARVLREELADAEARDDDGWHAADDGPGLEQDTADGW